MAAGCAVAAGQLPRDIREREGIAYDQRSLGILHFYRDQREFEAAIRVAELMRKYECNRRVISASEVVEIEPAFAECSDQIVGATYTAEDESGDAKKFTQGLAAVCARMGVTFMYGSEAVALEADPANSRIASIEVRTPDGYRSIHARDLVVSLGSYSASFLRPYGVSLAI